MGSLGGEKYAYQILKCTGGRGEDIAGAEARKQEIKEKFR